MKNATSNHMTLAAGILALALTADPGWAASYTWDGSESGDWGTAGNWVGNAAPPTGNIAVNHDVNFYQAGAGNRDTYLGAGARNIATLNFTADADSDVNIRMDNNSTTARSINLYSSSGENAINVASGADGSFRIYSPVSGGRINMTGNLTVNHNGSGLLTVEKINNTAGATVTKTGTGTLKIVPSSSYKYNGATTVNGGTLLVDSGASIDLAGSFPGGITVNAATLGGTGYIKGNVSISSSGKLAVGMDNSAAGTLTFENSNLTLADGAQLDYLLGTASDLVTGVDVLTLNAQEWSDFTFTEGTGFGPGTYVLIAATSISGSLGTTVSGTIGSYTGTLSVDGNNDLILTVSAGGEPTVMINQAAGQADPTSTSPINFTVVFSEAVTGFETGDVTLSGTAGATTGTVTEIAPNDGTTYNVAVSGMTGDGTVIASIAEDVVDGGNQASTSTDNTVTYDTSTTTVTINQAAGQGDPTASSPINFTVVFSEAVTGFETGDVTLSGTAGATTGTVTEIAPNDGTTYNVAVSGMTGDGTVIASIAEDVVDDGNSASTSTDNTVTYDTTAPTVTINQAAGQADPTGASPVNFTVVFSEAVTGFETGDVTLSGTAGAATGTVTEIAPNDGTTYNVAVSGMTGDGTVIASLEAGVAQDLAGNSSAASTSTDNTVTYSTAYTWDGSSSGNWSTAANWDTGTVPSGTTADVVFYQSGAGNLSTYLGGGKTLRSLTFNAEADSDVRIGMDDNATTGRQFIFDSDDGTATITVAEGAAGNYTIETATTSGRLELQDPIVINHNGSGMLTIKGMRDHVSGVQRFEGTSVTKSGTGTLVYTRGSAAASYYYVGETLVTGGTFRYGANNVLDVGAVTVNGGTFDLSTYSQTSPSVGTVTLQSGTIDGTGTLTSSSTFAMQSGTVNAILAGDVGLTKTTAGTVTLTNANTYTGDTDIQEGTLTLAEGGQLKFVIGSNGVNNQVKGSGTVNLDGGLALDLSGAAIADGNSWTLVDVSTLTESYGATFQVLGSFIESSDVWTWAEDTRKTWTFTEATGILSLAVVNSAPVAKAITVGAPAGVTNAIKVIGGKPAMVPTDADGDALVVSSVQNPSALLSATVTTDGTNILYTPGLNASGADTVQYVVSDGYGGYGTNTMYVTVTGQSLNLVSGPTLVNSQFQVTFAGIPNYNYAVDDATNSAGPWAFYTNLTAGTNGLFQLVVTNDPAVPQRFFRTR